MSNDLGRRSELVKERIVAIYSSHLKAIIHLLEVTTQVVGTTTTVAAANIWKSVRHILIIKYIPR